MIIIQKENDTKYLNVASKIFKSADDRSTSTQETVDCIRDFIGSTFYTSSEYNKFVDFFFTICAMVRSYLLECVYFDKMSSAGVKLSIAVRQEEEMFDFIMNNFDSLDIKRKIGRYVTDKTQLRLAHTQSNILDLSISNEHVITDLELNGVIVLNHLLNAVFNNVLIILEHDHVDIEKTEFLRLFNRVYINMFKYGWNAITALALSKKQLHRETMLLILTQYLTTQSVNRYNYELLCKNFNLDTGTGFKEVA